MHDFTTSQAYPSRIQPLLLQITTILFRALLLLFLLGCGLCVIVAQEGAEAVAEPVTEPLFSDSEWQTATSRSQGVRLAEGEGSASGNKASVSGSLTRMVMGLVVVVALALFIAWLVRRSGLHRRLPGQRGEHLELLESLNLGPKRGVSLLRVGGHYVVLGYNDQQMTAVATLSSLHPAQVVAENSEGPQEINGESSAPIHAAEEASLARLAQQAPAQESGKAPASVDDFRQRLSRLLGGK